MKRVLRNRFYINKNNQHFVKYFGDNVFADLCNAVCVVIDDISILKPVPKSDIYQASLSAYVEKYENSHIDRIFDKCCLSLVALGNVFSTEG